MTCGFTNAAHVFISFLYDNVSFQASCRLPISACQPELELIDSPLLVTHLIAFISNTSHLPDKSFLPFLKHIFQICPLYSQFCRYQYPPLNKEGRGFIQTVNYTSHRAFCNSQHFRGSFHVTCENWLSLQNLTDFVSFIEAITTRCCNCHARTSSLCQNFNFNFSVAKHYSHCEVHKNTSKENVFGMSSGPFVHGKNKDSVLQFAW